jgi:hypothetical protein
LTEVVEWIPQRPEVILALKVCDPGMGSGSFLASSLRYLTDALVASLYHYKLIERSEDGGVPRMADGQISELLSDEMLKLNPAHEGFEEALRAQLKRHIVERCLYGVDLDPLAVELGRMALWVETMDRDLPFGFLDHKLKVGNSLVGAWFNTYRDYPALAWEREGGDKDYQKNKPGNLINHHYVAANGKKLGDKFTAAIKARAKAVPDQLIDQLSGQMGLEAGMEASDVHDKLFKVFRELHRLPVHESDKRAALYRNKVLNNPDYHELKARMDLWCALWFWPGEHIDLAPLPLNFPQPAPEALKLAAKLARSNRFFHWELEFPDVFTDKQPGFDAMVGNPPWEIQKPNSKEFFSNHDPLYRAYGKQEALSKQLEYFRSQPELEHDWITYNAGIKGMSNWVKCVGQPFGDRVTTDKDGKKKHDLNLGGRGRDSFADSARLHKKWLQQRAKRKGFSDPAHPFLHQGSADLNTYKMFLEQSHALMRPQGRMGMIVPSGIYTDKGTTSLRELFLDHCDWQWLFGFENREKVFDIDSRFKFCPIVIQKGGVTQAIRAAFMHKNVDDWTQAELHVLAYPRERVVEFSPYSKSVLEIRSDKDLQVLQRIYANGVLLGDKSTQGWGVKYTREFDMTNDSKLFPPLAKWDSIGYQPDEYGHWLKGSWKPYVDDTNILLREHGIVLSRDGSRALKVDELQGIALPLYEGRMIGQFDSCEKGWVSGKGRSAVWRDLGWTAKRLEPQYLMDRADAVINGMLTGWKNPILNIGSATNSRSVIAGLIRDFPCNHSLNPITFGQPRLSLSAPAVMNSFVFDYDVRQRLGGLNLSFFVLDESVFPPLESAEKLESIVLSLAACSEAAADAWVGYADRSQSWRRRWAVSPHERLRQRVIADALVGHFYRLDWDEFRHVLYDCDRPSFHYREFAGSFDPKGFWRVDKELDPELRHTVLALVAFRDLQVQGIEEFLAQNDGEGWLLPETLCLADYGLGHDERAKVPQPVASRLGPRFLDWQLNEDVERSWQECAAHAALIRRIAPLPDSTAVDAEGSDPVAASQKKTVTYKQEGLF